MENILLIIAAVIGIVYGYKRGIIDQLSFTAGLIFALAQSSALLPRFTEFVDKSVSIGHYPSMAVGFVLMLIISIIVFKVLGKVLSVLLDTFNLNIIDRIAGAAFSAYVAALIVKAIFNIIG